MEQLKEIQFETIFKGFSDNRSNWTVVVNGQSFDYSQGSGYSKLIRPSLFSQKPINNYTTITRQAAKDSGMVVESLPADNGQILLKMTYARSVTKWDSELFSEIAHERPKLESVLHCLFLDSQCREMTFNDFCSEFGYNPDSKKDTALYFACQENSEKLRKALGHKYNEIQELVKDY